MVGFHLQYSFLRPDDSIALGREHPPPASY